MAKQPPREAQVMRVVAFLARYAHQPIESLLSMRITALHAFADSIAEILKQESDAVRQETDR